MTSPDQDALFLREATDRLLADARKLDESAVAEPSLLPGWTRGHVLTHLARNADALINVLAGRPMYRSAEARDGDIEDGAPRPPVTQAEDVTVTAHRLDGAFAAQSETAWQRTVELRNGVTDLASSVPFRRWIEVELHHVDLGVGYGLEDLPATFVDRELTNMAKRFSGHPALAQAVELRVEDGRVLHTGAAPEAPAVGEPVVVAGTALALMGWLTGRSTGSGLSAATELPTLPGL